MKAISIKQPWAWLIAAGHKDIENRTWRTNYRGRIFIHAGKTKDMAAFDEIYHYSPSLHDTLINTFLETGGLIGVATLDECVDHSDSPWFTGPFGFHLSNRTSLPFVPCQGRLGLFDIDEAWVEAQLEERKEVPHELEQGCSSGLCGKKLFHPQRTFDSLM